MDGITISINGQEWTVVKEELDKALATGTIIVKDENVMLFKKDEYETRLKNEKDSEYKKGRNDGVEILIKEQKRKLGLDFEGKDPDLLLTEFKKQIEKDLKIEPTKAIEERDKVIAQLRINLGTEEEKNTKLQSDYQAKENQNKLESALFSAIPEKAVNEVFSRADIAAMFRANGYSVELIDGKEVVKFNGVEMKNDKTLEPLTVKEVMLKFVTEKKLIEKDGRGGSDDPDPAKPGTMAAFEKEMNAKGIKLNSEECTQIMTERIKNKTLSV